MQALIRCVLAQILIVFCSVAMAQSPENGGIGLREILESLNERGERILFSSDLVREEFRVSDVPDFGNLQAGLEAVLQPFGLTVRPGPAGALLVVASETGPEKDTVGHDREAVDPEPLPEIIITSSLHRLEYAQPGDHAYLDRELATRIPAAAEEAVRITNRLPSVASGGISTRNHVRGGEQNETLYLLDGLRLYEPFHLKDFQAIATIINSNAVAGMDFYSGAFPARYGDRMSSVIDMSLREPEKNVETELSLSFFNASAMSLGRFGGEDRGDWLFAARRGNLDLIVDIIKPEFGSPDYQDFIGHVGWDFGALADISFNFLYSVDKISLSDADRGEQASASYDNEVFWLRWKAAWSDVLSSDTVLSFTDIRNERFGSVDMPGIVTGSLDDQREFRATAFKQDWVLVPSTKWMLGFGVGAKHLDGVYDFSSAKEVVPPFDSIFDNQLLQVRSFNIISDGAQYAAYGELRWQLSDNLAVDAGLRWDYQSYTTADNDEQTSPRVSLLYHVGDSTELRLGWGQYSQAQEVNELQVSDGSGSYYPAQRAEHFVANLQHTLANEIDIEFSIYRKRFRTLRPRYENAFNQLTVVPEIQFDRVMIDAASADSRGTELLVSRGSASDKLFWWLGYAWSEVEDQVANGKQKRSWDQTHTVKLGASWRWGPWDFSAAGEAHTGWPATQLVPDTLQNPDGSETLLVSTTDYNSLRYTVFHTLDVRVSRDIDIRHGDLTVFMEITNMLNRDNPCCTEYSLSQDGAGNSVLLSRPGNWLPLVPSLGVVWTF